MNALEIAIKEAFELSGAQDKANKAYLEFIKANFIIPIHKLESPDDPPRVLFLEEHGNYFLPVFTTREYFDLWALEIQHDIQLLKLSGVDLLKGIGENVTVCLNIQSPFYKEFNPSEIARMKSMVLKFFN